MYNNFDDYKKAMEQEKTHHELQQNDMKRRQDHEKRRHQAEIERITKRVQAENLSISALNRRLEEFLI